MISETPPSLTGELTLWKRKCLHGLTFVIFTVLTSFPIMQKATCLTVDGMVTKVSFMAPCESHTLGGWGTILQDVMNTVNK